MRVGWIPKSHDVSQEPLLVRNPCSQRPRSLLLGGVGAPQGRARQGQGRNVECTCGGTLGLQLGGTVATTWSSSTGVLVRPSSPSHRLTTRQPRIRPLRSLASRSLPNPPVPNVSMLPDLHHDQFLAVFCPCNNNYGHSWHAHIHTLTYTRAHLEIASHRF